MGQEKLHSLRLVFSRRSTNEKEQGRHAILIMTSLFRVEDMIKNMLLHCLDLTIMYYSVQICLHDLFSGRSLWKTGWQLGTIEDCLMQEVSAHQDIFTSGSSLFRSVDSTHWDFHKRDLTRLCVIEKEVK